MHNMHLKTDKSVSIKLWMMRKSPAKLRSIIHRIGCRKQWGREEKKRRRRRRRRKKENASIPILHELKMWIKHEWMKVLKVKLHGALHWARRKAEKGGRAAVGAAPKHWVQMSVSLSHMKLLRGLLLLVHYGWGAILRLWWCWFFWFVSRGETTPRRCQILLWGLVWELMGSDVQVQHVVHTHTHTHAWSLCDVYTQPKKGVNRRGGGGASDLSEGVTSQCFTQTGQLM